MELPREWDQMDADPLRDLSTTLFERLQQQEKQLAERDSELSVREKQLASNNEELKRKQLKIDQLTHEIATLNRWRYAKRSDRSMPCSVRCWMKASMQTLRPSVSRSKRFSRRRLRRPEHNHAELRFRRPCRGESSDTNPSTLNAAAAASSSALARM
jgi:hypothetical protein